MKNTKYFGLLLVVIFVFFLAGCKSENKENNESNNSGNTVDYSGTYNSEDSSQLTITKNNNNYKANVSLFRLTSIENCDVDTIENDVLNISCVDDNTGTIKFKFDYNKKILTVTETTWSLVNVGDSYDFSK